MIKQGIYVTINDIKTFIAPNDQPWCWLTTRARENLEM